MIVTRFPPSPTGALHLGGVRTALYSWLHARQNSGRFVLRIEDTDIERSTPEAVKSILDGLAWLGLDYDEGPYFQSKRFERYREVVAELLATGKAYRCRCSVQRLQEMREVQQKSGQKPKYDGRCRNANHESTGNTVVRFRNPLQGVVHIEDIVHGSITIANEQLDDLVIQRANGVPTYNLTVVVDDADMGITHVIRGDDHINNTPRQINLLEAMGAMVPHYAHVSMILGSDGKRLSKRHGAVNVLDYRAQGILADALLTYLARLGWSHGDSEIFSLDELRQHFCIEDVGRSAATFDANKLLWVNQQFLTGMSGNDLLQASRSFFQAAEIHIDDADYAESVMTAIQSRCKTLLDVVHESRAFFVDEITYSEQAVAKHISPDALAWLHECKQRFNALANWHAPELANEIKVMVKDWGIKFPQLAQPLRIALTGNTASPSIDITLTLIGRQKTVERIERAIRILG